MNNYHALHRLHIEKGLAGAGKALHTGGEGLSIASGANPELSPLAVGALALGAGAKGLSKVLKKNKKKAQAKKKKKKAKK